MRLELLSPIKKCNFYLEIDMNGPVSRILVLGFIKNDKTTFYS